MRPNCVQGHQSPSPAPPPSPHGHRHSSSRCRAPGAPHTARSTARNTATAAQMVSSSLKRPSLRLRGIVDQRDQAAPGTPRFIPAMEAAHRAARSSPKCALRSRRWRYGRPLALPAPQPAASIQRRSVSWSTVSPSSLARCSATRVGPNRVATSPLYFCRMSAQHPLPRRDRRPAIGDASHLPVAERLRTAAFEHPPEPLRLAVADAHQRGRLAPTPTLPGFHPPQHLHPRQLPSTHRCPSQSRPPRSRA